ncbi:ribbon-helix-helix domain-containing protein [Chthonobacter rhizosphaerae]|uniref:ribbon-helix-helix domain-containing protein n=1 Tax=Chthonobacter rhizosphaerae TaxID=2735553 RepID=UPI0015EF6FF9
MTVKRSVSLAGHRTSVALEPEFWAALERMAAERGQSIAAVVAGIDRTRKTRNLASALRVAVLTDLQEKTGLGNTQSAS